MIPGKAWFTRLLMEQVWTVMIIAERKMYNEDVNIDFVLAQCLFGESPIHVKYT